MTPEEKAAARAAEADRAARALARGFDTPEDVVASRRRKGPSGTAADAPTLLDRLAAATVAPTSVGDVTATPEGRSRVASVARTRRGISSGLGGVLEGETRRARTVPVVGDAIGSWMDTGTAPVTGAVEGATLGYADELGGLGAALSGGDYEETRDRMRARADSDREASPVAYGAGELAGAVATTPFLPSVGRVGNMAGRIGMGAVEGGLYGAAAGLGNSDADLSTNEGMAEAAGDTAMGGAGGALFGAGGAAVGEMAGAAGTALRRHAARADELRTIAPAGGLAAGADALRSSGTAPRGMRGPERTAAELADSAGRLREMGLGGVNTAEGMAEAAGAARRRFGSEIGATRGVLEEAGEVPVARLRDAMLRHADEVGRTTSGAPIADAIRARAERLSDVMGGAEAIPYSRAVEELQGLGNGLNWTDRAGRPVTATTEAGRRLYGAVRGEMDDWARPILGDEGLAGYRNSRANERVAISADEAAREAANRVGSNRGLGLSDYVLGSGGMAASGATGSIWPTVAGAAAMFGNRAMRLREPTLRAATAEGVRSLLESGGARALGEYGPVLGNALRRGGEVFSGLHAALMRSDPDYARTLEEASAGPEADTAWFDQYAEEDSAADSADTSWFDQYADEDSPEE